LTAIEREIAADARNSLDPAGRADLETTVQRRLAPLSGRLTPEQRAEAGHLLFEQELRRRLGLPVLSLFSPAARAVDGD
jgi:hypothetical protein